MANRKCFHWYHLDRLWQHTTITDADHATHDSTYIYSQMRASMQSGDYVKRRVPNFLKSFGGMRQFLCIKT
jgi:hypothetical protein